MLAGWWGNGDEEVRGGTSDGGDDGRGSELHDMATRVQRRDGDGRALIRRDES